MSADDSSATAVLGKRKRDNQENVAQEVQRDLTGMPNDSMKPDSKRVRFSGMNASLPLTSANVVTKNGDPLMVEKPFNIVGERMSLSPRLPLQEIRILHGDICKVKTQEESRSIMRSQEVQTDPCSSLTDLNIIMNNEGPHLNV